MTLIAFASTRRSISTAFVQICAAALAAAAAPNALAQASGNPGDIIVERNVMPRDAFKAVPRDENPVAVRATTFPAPAFDATIGSLVSDADLTQVHGSQGVASATPGGAASLQALATILGGSATGSKVAMGPGGVAPTTKGIGAAITTSITGALAPLSGGLAGLGGLK